MYNTATKTKDATDRFSIRSPSIISAGGNSKATKAGKAVVVTEQMRQASLSFEVGNGEFQAKQWIAPNAQANSPKRIAGTACVAHPGYSTSCG
ncbi:MAG: hypothetical protein ALECFALPRED_001237 [Alectoria fallacina]|uniref:Uncharacterized protein n=1 Tax=Alectoria fallacina TaxID=1903189 RepID=A0A8H3IG73_9LECA|nr:MAG: hypothetical protein ALECFALPRED_001237 [Alectoria fallacina]